MSSLGNLFGLEALAAVAGSIDDAVGSVDYGNRIDQSRGAELLEVLDFMRVQGPRLVGLLDIGRKISKAEYHSHLFLGSRTILSGTPHQLLHNKLTAGRMSMAHPDSQPLTGRGDQESSSLIRPCN